MSIRDVNDATVWEFQAALDGWKEANQSEEKAPAMSDSDAARLGIEGF